MALRLARANVNDAQTAMVAGGWRPAAVTTNSQIDFSRRQNFRLMAAAPACRPTQSGATSRNSH
jgi:hypothetical protein